MTLIEIIKTSLLGFSAIFVLIWIFFYLLLKIKKGNQQPEKIEQPVSYHIPKTTQRQFINNPSIFTQPVIYSNVIPANNHPQFVDTKRYYYENQNNLNANQQKPRINNSEIKFVIFNKNQFGYNDYYRY